MATRELWKNIIETGQQIAINNPDVFVVDTNSWGSTQYLAIATMFPVQDRVFQLTLSFENGDTPRQEIYLSDIAKSSLEDDARYRLSVSLDVEESYQTLLELAKEFPDEDGRMLARVNELYEVRPDGEVYSFSDNYAETSIDPENAMGILTNAAGFRLPRNGTTLRELMAEMEKRQARFKLA